MEQRAREEGDPRVVRAAGRREAYDEALTHRGEEIMRERAGSASDLPAAVDLSGVLHAVGPKQFGREEPATEMQVDDQEGDQGLWPDSALNAVLRWSLLLESSSQPTKGPGQRSRCCIHPLVSLHN